VPPCGAWCLSPSAAAIYLTLNEELSCIVGSHRYHLADSLAEHAKQFTAYTNLWRCAQQNLADVGMWLARRILAVLVRDTDFHDVANCF